MKSLTKPLLLTAVLTLAFLSLHLGWWGPVTEEVLLQQLFQQHWTVAWPVFVLGSVIYTALGGPRQVLAFSCGFLVGGWQFVQVLFDQVFTSVPLVAHQLADLLAQRLQQQPAFNGPWRFWDQQFLIT